jgi:hypothetical protein
VTLYSHPNDPNVFTLSSLSSSHNPRSKTAPRRAFPPLTLILFLKATHHQEFVEWSDGDGVQPPSSPSSLRRGVQTTLASPSRLASTPHSTTTSPLVYIFIYLRRHDDNTGEPSFGDWLTAHECEYKFDPPEISVTVCVCVCRELPLIGRNASPPQRFSRSWGSKGVTINVR